METALTITLWFVLVAHLLMALVALWRIVRGENSIARLAGLDLFGTLTVALLVIISMLMGEQRVFYLEVAVATTALGYLSTVAIAKFISDHKVF